MKEKTNTINHDDAVFTAVLSKLNLTLTLILVIITCVILV